MNIIVCKFGGTSVASSEKLQQVVKILKLNRNRRCVVLSAPGKAADAPVKVTDMLIAIVNKSLMRRSCAAELKELKQRFHAIYDPLNVPQAKIDEVLTDLEKRQKSRHDPKQQYRL